MNFDELVHEYALALWKEFWRGESAASRTISEESNHLGIPTTDLMARKANTMAKALIEELKEK